MHEPPETGNQAPDLGPLLAKVDLGTGHNITPGHSGGGMHRSDSIDLALVLEGECDLVQPGDDGELKEIHLQPGDFIVQNGNFHEWRNRSGSHCVIYIVTFGTERL